MSDLERRVATIEAVEAIKNLKATYARACDPLPDADAIAELFLEDGVFDSGPHFGAHQGREAIRTHFMRGPELLRWAHHVIVSPIIEVAPDLRTARGSWYLWQPMTAIEDGVDRARWLAGEYHDEYAVDASGQWRFANVSLDVGIYATYEDGWA